ncbi:MAG: PAS domain-containing sensor histidine kinase [Balneolaceae bacterium]|nr:MAG: PAS domain-containing sensor histidine kinase [Balneolaceae bacterium]
MPLIFMNKSPKHKTSGISNMPGDAHLLRLLMDHIPYSIFFKDKKSRFTKINKVCAEKFGLSDPKEAIGKTDFDIFDNVHAQEAFKDEQRMMKTGEPITGKIEKESFPGDEKTVYWTTTNKFPLYDEEGNLVGTFGSTRDITEQKSAQIALLESEKKYRNIFENIQDVIYRTDKNGIVTEISPSIEKYSGYKRADIIGSNALDFYYHSKDGEKLVAILREKSEVTDFEIRLKTADHRLVYTSVNAYILKDDNGKPVGVEGIMRDVTARKLAEDKLRESDETLKKLSEQVPGLIFQFQQFPDGHSSMPFASIGSADIFGLSPNEVTEDASKAFQNIYEDDLAKTMQSIQASYETMEDWIMDFRVLQPKLGLRWLRGNSRPEKQADGSVIWHGYISDITESKQKEKELTETFHLVSDQNSRLLNFAHIVSHNLRNHAGSIQTILSLYEEGDNTEDEKTELLELLNIASTRLNESIHDLNEIIDSQEKVDKGLDNIGFQSKFEKVKEILSSDIKLNNVTLKDSIPDGLKIYYNSAYLESILLNLISNAIKYRHPERDPVVSVDVTESDDQIKLTVSDNGIGIDLDKYGEKLFGMYNTFHGNQNAKGIGLYITKNQVESLGGEIDVESTVDKGTTFNVIFKTAQESESCSQLF